MAGGDSDIHTPGPMLRVDTGLISPVDRSTWLLGLSAPSVALALKRVCIIL